jgi:hypothetical protein
MNPLYTRCDVPVNHNSKLPCEVSFFLEGETGAQWAEEEVWM